jgi:hypothetical protein
MNHHLGGCVSEQCRDPDTHGRDDDGGYNLQGASNNDGRQNDDAAQPG